MRRNQIVLTEQDLHMLVEDAVRVYLQENDMEEGVWGGLKNVYQAVNNGNFYLKNAYNAGNNATSFQKYATQAINAIEYMKGIAKQTKNTNVYKGLERASSNIQFAAQGFKDMAVNATKNQEAPANQGQVGWNSAAANRKQKNP